MSFWRILQYLIVGALVGAAPLLVASAFWGPGILSIGFFGLFAGLAAIGNHVRPGLIATAFLAVAGGLAVSVAWTPLLGALLFAGIGVAVGLSTRWRMESIAGTIGFGVGFLLVVPPALPWFPQPTAFDAGYSLAVAGILAVMGAWAVFAFGYLTRKMPSKPRDPLSPRTVRYFTVALALALFIGTYIVLRWYPGGTGAWLIMTILIVLQPDWDTVRTKTTHRILGTLLGVAIAAVLVLIIPPNLHAIIGLPLILIALAYKQGGVYWRYTTIITPGVVLLVTQGMDQSKALTTDATRLAFTLGAIAVVALVATLLSVVSRVERPSSPAA